MSETIKNLKNRVSGNEAGARGMVVHYPAYFALTAGELREACEANPDHPQSKIAMRATQGMLDTKRVFLEIADLRAILYGGDSVMEVEYTDHPTIQGAKVKKTRKVHLPKDTHIVSAEEVAAPIMRDDDPVHDSDNDPALAADDKVARRRHRKG